MCVTVEGCHHCAQNAKERNLGVGGGCTMHVNRYPPIISDEGG